MSFKSKLVFFLDFTSFSGNLSSVLVRKESSRNFAVNVHQYHIFPMHVIMSDPMDNHLYHVSFVSGVVRSVASTWVLTQDV